MLARGFSVGIYWYIYVCIYIYVCMYRTIYMSAYMYVCMYRTIFHGISPTHPLSHSPTASHPPTLPRLLTHSHIHASICSIPACALLYMHIPHIHRNTHTKSHMQAYIRTYGRIPRTPARVQFVHVRNQYSLGRSPTYKKKACTNNILTPR